MRSDQVRDVVDALDGLLRMAYEQGQRQMVWDELCRLCEDAVVAGGLPDGAMDPWTIETLVTAQSAQLAVWLAGYHRQGGLAELDVLHPRGRPFSLRALVRTLEGLHDAHAAEREAALSQAFAAACIMAPPASYIRAATTCAMHLSPVARRG